MSLFPPNISIQVNRTAWKGTNIEFVKRSEAHDDLRSCALCLDMAEERRKANEDIDKDDIGCRGEQGANEKYPCVNLRTCSQKREMERTREQVRTVRML